MKIKFNKYYVALVLVLLSLIVIPVTYSKYKSTLNVPLTLSIRKPVYTVEFEPNYNVLPSGYVELEYIQSTGEELINLGMVPNKDLKVDMTFTPLESTQYMYFGTSGYRVFYNNGNLQFNISNESATYGATMLNQKSRVVLENYKISLNNVVVATHTAAASEPSQGENIYVFGGYYNSVVHPVRMKLYALKIWNNSILVRNMIPCYRTSDSKAGLYDLVNGVFYTDANGDFIKGANRQNISYGTSTSLMANTYSLPGYTISSWNTNADGSGTSYSDGQSVLNLSSTEGEVIKLFAQWTGANYTITFNVNGGDAWSGSTCTSQTGGSLNGTTCTKQVAYSSTYGVLPTPNRNGYTFDGWYTAAGNSTQITSSSTVGITNNTTIYAHWTMVSNAIDYGSKTKATITAGENLTIGTETFKVLTNNGGTILAMPYYNLYIAGNPSTILQATAGNASAAGMVAFASSVYWSAGEDAINMSDARNSIQSYITAYQTTLENLGATGITVRIGKYSELTAAGITDAMRNPSQIGYYWMGSSSDGDAGLIRTVGISGFLQDNYYIHTNIYGVRPVLVIN